MFEGNNFSIIEYGIDLAPKRAEVLSNVIIKNKGVVIDSSKSKRLLILVGKANIHYYISSNKIKLDFLEKKFTKEKVDKFIKDKLYNLDWITNCAKEKTKLNPEGYKINLSVNFSGIKRKAPEDIRLDQFYSKKKKQIKDDSIKKEDFFPIQEKKEEEEGLELTETQNPDDVVAGLTQKDPEEQKFLRRGFNDRMKIFLSQDSIDSLESKRETQPPSKSNKELFDDIWKNISRLKNEGKENDIFSKHNTDDEDNASDGDTKSVVSNSSTTTFTSKRSFPDKSKFAFNNTNKENLNGYITTELEKILDFHQNEGNVFESLAYRKAIAQLKNSTEKITSCDQLKKFKYLGKSIGQKIKEIILTGKLGKTDYLKDDERNNTLKLLCQVWGIGMGIANKLYRKGIKTIDDLRKNQDLLNKNQKVGLKYYEEIKERIPRAECEEVLSKVKNELFTILPEELLQIQLCGSYRRGKATCGDMDILITRNDDGCVDGILQALVDKLMISGLITDILSLSNGSGRNTFMGVSQLPNKPHRRLDIKIYLKEFYPFAMLYFTGSAYFNRSMRLFAGKIGYTLSDLGLQKVHGYRKNKVPTGTSIPCKDEEEIFKALGLDYKAPNERDI
jgi:DNA polymerase/3'-5' exonuclease PolX